MKITYIIAILIALAGLSSADYKVQEMGDMVNLTFIGQNEAKEDQVKLLRSLSNKVYHGNGDIRVLDVKAAQESVHVLYQVRNLTLYDKFESHKPVYEQPLVISRTDGMLTKVEFKEANGRLLIASFKGSVLIAEINCDFAYLFLEGVVREREPLVPRDAGKLVPLPKPSAQ